MVSVVRAAGAGFVNYDWPRPGSDKPVPKISYVKGYQPWNWMIGSGVYVDDIDEKVMSYAWQLLAALLVISLLMIVLGTTLVGSIVGALRHARNQLNRISQGHFHDVIDVKRADEVGQLMYAMKSMQIRMGFEVSDSRRLPRNRHGSDSARPNRYERDGVR